VGLLAIVSSLSFAPACTIVVGDEPARREDASADAGALEDDDAATGEEAGVVDAGMLEDGGVSNDAGGTLGLDAALTDAGAGADADAAREEAGPTDSGVIDTGPPLDCDGGGTLYYPDGDDDGFGRSAELVKRCAKPAGGNWALRGGDCKDNDPNVYPQQPAYFGMAYMGADGNPSFDYDCSSNEEGNPSQQTLEGGCGLLELVACHGTGYLPRPRTGTGVNPLCGSTSVGTCMAGALGLGCSTSMATTPEPYECK
jgi:hypothetical protein